MCGGIAASLIYDFLLYPQTRNFSSRIGILVHGPQEEYVEINGEENNSPGPSHWPKQWTMWNFSFSICQHFIYFFTKAISFILILQCVSSQSPVLCVVWTMTPLIKMLFSQVSLCIHIHTVWYWTNFKLRSVHPHLLYVFTRITQCMFTSRWPRQCFLYNAFQSVYII